ncbi:MAG: urease accessory UreF family protein [Candidatus Thiodiazotropha sp.]
MPTTTDALLPRLRLLQLVSPSLPVGAFTYSQGLEWAVECGWVTDAETLKAWIEDLLDSAMAHLEIPLFERLYQAAARQDDAALDHWTHYLLASRETRELRQEERNRGRALASLLPELGLPVTDEQLQLLRQCQLAGFAHAAHHWRIPLPEAASAYLWGWLENITLAGVKIIPLGQTAGQQLIAELTEAIPRVLSAGLAIPDEMIGAACTAQAIASSLHETQYTRIYRS